jgi:hypothetical protein
MISCSSVLNSLGLAGVNNDHQFDRLSQFWYDSKTDDSMILGLQEEPAEGWQPCCWSCAHTAQPPCKACTCKSAACELSFSNAKPRDRISKLIGELISIYIPRGVRGVELDFQRGLDYFPASVNTTERRRLMRAFVSGVRRSLEGAAGGKDVALGLRVTPSWKVLRLQGLDQLDELVKPREQGGCGVTYLNYGVNFYAFQPHDSELASLVAAMPAGTPFYFETTSWVGTARKMANCTSSAKVRVTKEELWTTALLARSYGARGISTFNFIYTRPYFDLPCEFALNQPYSEPLYGALNKTKDVSFLENHADQFYRLSAQQCVGCLGQIPEHGLRVNTSHSVRIVAVPPTGGWHKMGRLRLLFTHAVPGRSAAVALQGTALAPITNASSQYSDPDQATFGRYPLTQWLAFDVPPTILQAGNNSITVSCMKCKAGFVVLRLELSMPVGTRVELKTDDAQTDEAAPRFATTHSITVKRSSSARGVDTKTDNSANPCCQAVALADCWGFAAGEDSTASIQAAIDCPLAHTVVVRNMSGPWIVAPPYEPLLAIRAPETVSGRQRTFLDMSPLHTIFLGPALWRY